jgi:hypothetical protein
MASPFPGMDPYLEGEMWQEFHTTFATTIRAQLKPQLTPKYVALMAKRYVLEYPVLDIVATSSRSVYPDIHVVKRSSSQAALAAVPGQATAPTLELPSYLEVPQLSVEVREVADRRLVTVIEVLSPANKVGEGVREYQERRTALLRSYVHLVEIDFLRGGARIPLHGAPPPAPYYVYLSRSERRPYTQIWPIQLRDRLPTVPVPLDAPDPDALLDLQAAIEACYALVEYETLLLYDDPVPGPALPPEDAAWVASRLAAFRAQQGADPSPPPASGDPPLTRGG